MEFIRPLPSITFRSEPPPVVSLPRMDVAAFVGFAQKGPINIPVPVEDYPHFMDIFGGTYQLAWDDETATWQTACLAPTVKDFFAQGGKRCWIVRVAHKPIVNHFMVAGLLQTTASKTYTSVVARARSAGSWSDKVQIGAGILIDVVNIQAGEIKLDEAIKMSVVHLRGQPLSTGELLQLDFSDDLHRAYVPLHQADIIFEDDAIQINANPDRVHWFRRVKQDTSMTLTGKAHTVVARKEADEAVIPPMAAISIDAEFDISTTMYLKIAATGTTDFVDAVQVGDWLTFTVGDQTIWLLVAQKKAEEFVIQSAWYEGFATPVPTLTIGRAARVRMALQIRENLDNYRVLSNLAFSAPHPRFVGYLPDDMTLYKLNIGTVKTDAENARNALLGEIQNPRFPVYVPLADNSIILPLGLEAAPVWRDAEKLAAMPLVRDGLVPDVTDLEVIKSRAWSDFWQALYLDPKLRFAGQRSLVAEANDYFYVQQKSSIGLHTLFPIEEISMVALPDAYHRGWFLTQREHEIKQEPPPEKPIDPCSHDDRIFKPHAQPLPEPEQKVILHDNEVNRYWKLAHPLEYLADGLLEIQIQLAKLAAARGDFMAILSLPQIYRTANALQHQRDLYKAFRLLGDTTPSYVALYHPWLVNRDDNGNLLHIVPDGATCGVLAKRSLERGAWVAPSNIVLRGTLALSPRFSLDDEASLYNAGINLIQEQARGFVVWGANTQTFDPAFSDINVRRLLILLRRLALIEGQNYVFAPHSPAFRRRVKQIFEQRLAVLFEHGAFAGNNPAEAYQVGIDETLNTQKSIEQGQLIIELRIAPSRPILYITVRMVQTASGLLTLEEILTNG